MDNTLTIITFIGIFALVVLAISSASVVIDELRKENKYLKDEIAHLKQFRKR